METKNPTTIKSWGTSSGGLYFYFELNTLLKKSSNEILCIVVVTMAILAIQMPAKSFTPKPIIKDPTIKEFTLINLKRCQASVTNTSTVEDKKNLSPLHLHPSFHLFDQDISGFQNAHEPIFLNMES